MRFRVRAPNGVSNITLPDDTTIHELERTISEKTGLPTFEIKSGFPPQPLDLAQFNPELKLVDTGLKLDGEQLIVVEKDIGEPLKRPLHHDAATSKPPPAVQTSVPTNQTTAPRQSASVPQVKAAEVPSNKAEADAELDPPEIAVPSQNGTLVLRVMPDDNSCMFRALSSAVLGDEIDSMYDMRTTVSNKIKSQPDMYSEAVLEKPPEQYCRWIKTADAWGGAIELGILSEEFDCEIYTINVQDLQVYRFNQGAPRRCILVYSGIHYDVVALSPSEPPHTKADLPAQFDRKVFESYEDDIIAAATQLCEELRKRHYYTDTQNFTIKCNVCGWRGQGEKGATEHAKSTGHFDFGEAE